MKTISLQPLEKSVTKTISIPGSKSYTNRALLMASLTKNSVTIAHPLFSDDTKAMILCLQKLGIKIETTEKEIIVKGSINDIQDDTYELNVNLAATAIRFLLPLLAITPGTKIIKGKDGLNKRPIGELVDGLKQLGANITYLEKEGHPPIKVLSSKLQSGTISMNGNVSSQFFSAIFMIAPLIGEININVMGEQVSKPYIGMTIDSMKQFGIEVENKKYKSYRIKKGQTYHAENYSVEGDFSSAGYFFAIAALTESKITLQNLNPQSVQADKKLLSVLEKMGSTISMKHNEIAIHGNGVKPVQIDMIDFPDQAQTVAVLAAFAKGETKLTGLQSLHVKETDRLQATEKELHRMGIKTESTYDSLIIYGGNPNGSTIETYGDQRMAMAFAVAGTKLQGITIENPNVVNKTFPTFWNALKQIGVQTK